MEVACAIAESQVDRNASNLASDLSLLDGKDYGVEEDRYSFFRAAKELAENDDCNPLSVLLKPQEAHHMQVLRIRAGERVILSDGVAYAVVAEVVESPSKKSNTCVVKPIECYPISQHPHLTLVQGISKGERMDLLIRQAVELGVKHIIPAITNRCIVSLDEKKKASKLKRWENVAVASAKQSGQAVPPIIYDPMELADALHFASSMGDIFICPWEESNTGSIGECLQEANEDSRVFLFIGPEGGFEESEVEAIRQIGGKVVTLGKTILRTETAGVIASALVIYELGGLGNIRARKGSQNAGIAKNDRELKSIGTSSAKTADITRDKGSVDG